MDIIRIRKKNHAFLHVDCEPSVANELCDFFTFFVPGYKFMPSYKNKMWDGKIRLFDTRTKELYAGLYQYIEEFANAEGRDYRIELEHDNYYGLPKTDTPIDMSFMKDLILTAGGNPIEARDYQLKAIEHGLTRKSAMLISPTASGKSLIIYSLLRYVLDAQDKRALIIVPTTSLVEQMYADFGDYSTQDPEFDVKSMCHRIYAGRPKFAEDERVIITTWQSIYKMPGSWFEQFGAVFGDEAHNFKAKSLTSILSKCRDAEYRYGTTGTLDGTQTHKLVLEGLFGPAFYVTTTKKLMDEGSLSDLDISVLLLKYSEEFRKGFGKRSYQEEIDFIVTHEKRNQLITNLALDQDGNTLVLFQFVEKHGKPLYHAINDKRINVVKYFM